jgi:hypothetical protein
MNAVSWFCYCRLLDPLLPFWEHEGVRIISERRVREFSQRFSDAALALATWMRAVRAAAWRTHAGVKAQFHDSDLVGDRTLSISRTMATG